MNEARNKVFALLEKIPISVLLSQKKRQIGDGLIDVHESTSLDEVLDLLSEKDILAVPVYKYNERNLDEKLFTGVVGVYDILVWTVFQKFFESLEALETEKNVEESFQEYLKINHSEDMFLATPVSELVGLTPESNHPFTLHSSDPIASLLKVFTSGAYHRVLILDDLILINSALAKSPSDTSSESAMCLLSQSDLVRFLFDLAVLSNNDASWPDSSGMTKKLQAELGSAIKEVMKISAKEAEAVAVQRWLEDVLGIKDEKKERGIVKVSDTVSAISAFRSLYVNQVSAVAVVDSRGGMIANLSASDLRGMTKNSLESLACGVFEFLEKYSKRTPYQIKADQLRSVAPTDSLFAATGMAVESYIHRVWIIDPSDKPVGLLTLTDILGVFVPSMSEEIV